MLDLTPVLYILMRTDLASLNPGKAVAQGSHAANQMVHRIQRGTCAPGVVDQLCRWQSETPSGFGTCIVLGVTERRMRSIVESIEATAQGACAGIVHDPTYPLRDGETLHLIPLDTCAYAFGAKSRLQPYLSDLDLMA